MIHFDNTLINPQRIEAVEISETIGVYEGNPPVKAAIYSVHVFCCSGRGLVEHKDTESEALARAAEIESAVDAAKGA